MVPGPEGVAAVGGQGLQCVRGAECRWQVGAWTRPSEGWGQAQRTLRLSKEGRLVQISNRTVGAKRWFMRRPASEYRGYVEGAPPGAEGGQGSAADGQGGLVDVEETLGLDSQRGGCAGDGVAGRLW